MKKSILLSLLIVISFSIFGIKNCKAAENVNLRIYLRENTPSLQFWFTIKDNDTNKTLTEFDLWTERMGVEKTTTLKKGTKVKLIITQSFLASLLIDKKQTKEFTITKDTTISVKYVGPYKDMEVSIHDTTHF